MAALGLLSEGGEASGDPPGLALTKCVFERNLWLFFLLLLLFF